MDEIYDEMSGCDGWMRCMEWMRYSENVFFNRRWTQINADAGIVGESLSGGLC
jgi:hypothetical protein